MFHVPAHKQIDPAKQAGQIVNPTPAASCTPDFSYVDHGSIVVLDPRSEGARAWCRDHLPEDCPRMGYAYAIEKRYFGDILDGIDGDGFRI